MAKSANGTTLKTAAAMKSMASKDRSGPGNKRTSTSANRQSQSSQEGAATSTYRRTHNGPF